MALLTEESVKLLQTRIEDAEVTLRAQKDAYEKSNIEYNNVKSEIKDKELEFETILTKFKDDGKTQIALFESYVRDYNQAAKNAGTTALKAVFSTEEYKEAWGYEYVLESTPPLNLDEDSARERIRDYEEGDLASKHTALRAERDDRFKAELTKANNEKSAKQTKTEDVISEEKAKAEKAIDAAKEALSKAKEELAVAEEEGADEATLTTLRANLTTAETGYQNANKASVDIKEITEFLENHMAEFNAVNDSFAKAANELVLAGNVYNYTLKPISEYVEKAKSSDLLKQFEAERKTRKVHVRQTLKNKERIKALINNSNNDIKDKQTEFNNDTAIFIKDIKSELNVDTSAESLINAAISDLNEKYTKEGKGATGVFPADQAFKLTRESLFDLELAGINKKIKAACQKGLTSIDLSEDEITGPQILALHNGNYKISHYEVKQQSNVAALYRDATKLMIRVDWGFAEEEPKS